jgi:DNA-binding NtrC family response regulator
MPPLRDRADDVIELAAMFVEMFGSQMGRGPLRLSEEALEVLRSYDWPGNVRELKNAVERAVVLGQGSEVQSVDFGLPITNQARPPQGEMMTLKEAELRHIQYVLERCGGNKTKACRVLGIGRATLYSKLEGKEA